MEEGREGCSRNQEHHVQAPRGNKELGYTGKAGNSLVWLDFEL